MPQSKYGKYICTELIPDIPLPRYREWEREMIGDSLVNGHRRPMEHLIWTDGTVIPGSFYSEIVWCWGPSMPNQLPPRTEAEIKEFIEEHPEAAFGGPPPHTHPFPELLSFFRLDMDNPHDLGCQIEFWIGGEQYIMEKSFVAYIPAKVVHCPLKLHGEDLPMFHYTMGPGQSYT